MAPDRPLDGIDVLGQIAAERVAESRRLFWRSRRAERTWKAVRQDHHKYISRQDGDRLDEYLFDLSKDSGETNNLLSAQPAQAVACFPMAWEGLRNGF